MLKSEESRWCVGRDEDNCNKRYDDSKIGKGEILIFLDEK